MTKTVHVPINKFSVASVIREINKHIAGRNVESIFFNPTSLLNGTLEIKTTDSQFPNIIERPSKFKQNATSKYYCVYFDKFSQKWRYKFVRKNKVYNSKRYDTELQAALAYDNHVYSVDGNTRKLNFPEKVFK